MSSYTIPLPGLLPLHGKSSFTPTKPDTLTIADDYRDAPFAHVVGPDLWTARTGRRVTFDQAFACRHCGADCGTHPCDGTGAICETCCGEDPDGHEFVYDRDLREHACERCGMFAPHDFYSDQGWD